MNGINAGRCKNPICKGNGNCAVCPKRMAGQSNSDSFEAVAEYTVSVKEDTAVCYAAKVGPAGDADMVHNAEYAIAIDLGTTTLVFALADKISGQVVHTITMLNSQRKYGADVLSRIQASVEGKKDELRASIQNDLCGGIERLLKECRTTAKIVSESNQQTINIEHIVISGNTTMVHLLMGYDCSSLGVYPFTPVNTETIIGTAEEILGYRQQDNVIKVTVLPGISAFVGGDIVSGLYALGFAENDKPCLFVDLGTNGEIVLGNADRMLTTSVAAGPAFEGGNISCGTGSIAGAICSVEIDVNNMSYGDDTDKKDMPFTIKVKTIQDANPCGICGTGIIEAIAELVKCGISDETGLLADEYFDDGFLLVDSSEDDGANCQCIEKDASVFEKKRIRITGQDIRQFQLAKAAVRTGIEILMKEYGITAKDVDKVYISGGFGYYLDVAKAAATGMLPKGLAIKASAVGNTSLAGAVKYIHDSNACALMQEIVDRCEGITLANDSNFTILFTENTFLGE